MRLFISIFLVFSVMACSPNSSSNVSSTPENESNITFNPVNDASRTGFLIDDVIVNIRYACLAPNIFESYTTLEDPTFKCPTDSTSVVFFIGQYPDNMIVIGEKLFEDALTFEQFTIPLAEVVTTGSINPDSNAYANVARFLQSLDLQQTSGGVINDSGPSRNVIFIPDTAHDLLRQTNASGEYVNTAFTASLFNQSHQSPDTFGTNTTVIDYLQMVQDNLSGLSTEFLARWGGSASDVSLAMGGGMVSSATALANANKNAIVTRAGVYFLQAGIAQVPDAANNIPGIAYITKNFVDRTGNLFGFSSFIFSQADDEFNTNTVRELLYSMDTVPDIAALSGVDPTTSGMGLELDGRFNLRLVGEEKTIGNVVNTGVTTNSEFEAKGRFVEGRMFAFEQQVREFFVAQGETVEDADAFIDRYNLSVDNNDYGTFEPIVSDQLPSDYEGLFSLERTGLITPFLDPAIWLSSTDEIDFPLHLEFEMFRSAQTEAEQSISTTHATFLLDTFRVTVLENGNIVSNFDGDCEAVDPDTMIDSGGQQEYPMGFVTRLLQDDTNNEQYARMLFANALPRVPGTVPELVSFGVEMSFELNMERRGVDTDANALIIRASGQGFDDSAPSWFDSPHFFLGLTRIPPDVNATDDEIVTQITAQNFGLMRGSQACP